MCNPANNASDSREGGRPLRRNSVRTFEVRANNVARALSYHEALEKFLYKGPSKTIILTTRGEKVKPHRHVTRRQHPAACHYHTLCIQTRCPRQQPPRMQRETIQAQWGFAVQRPPLEAGRGRSVGRVQGWTPRTAVQTRTQITTGRDISGYIIPTTTCCSRWPERRTAEG